MAEKRDAILKATLELISEHGFHGTPMSMIAERADVGAGTIYRYFESKDDLITQLYLEIKRGMGKAVLVGYSEEVSVRERFRTLWLNMLHYCMRHPRELAFLEQFENSPFKTPEVEQVFSEYYGPVMRFFEYAFDEGVFKRMPMEMVGIFTSQAAISIAKLHAAGTLTVDDELTEHAMNASWDALKR
jgi:AcrR family transcriptional regulator